MFYFGKDYVKFTFRKTIDLISKIAVVAFAVASLASMCIFFN